jgi:hypothetical protein
VRCGLCCSETRSPPIRCALQCWSSTDSRRSLPYVSPISHSRVEADVTRTPSQTHWEAGETADSASIDSPKDGFTGATGTAKVAGAPKSDESDPLGLMRGGILA